MCRNESLFPEIDCGTFDSHKQSRSTEASVFKHIYEKKVTILVVEPILLPRMTVNRIANGPLVITVENERDALVTDQTLDDGTHIVLVEYEDGKDIPHITINLPDDVEYCDHTRDDGLDMDLTVCDDGIWDTDLASGDWQDSFSDS